MKKFQIFEKLANHRQFITLYFISLFGENTLTIYEHELNQIGYFST